MPKTVYLKDYTPPAFTIEDVFLSFHLDETKTLVQNSFRVKKIRKEEKNLFLHGENLDLLSSEDEREET